MIVQIRRIYRGNDDQSAKIEKIVKFEISIHRDSNGISRLIALLQRGFLADSHEGIE